MNDLSKRLTLLAGSALLALGLSACGNNQGGGSQVECDPGTFCPCATSEDCPTGETCTNTICLGPPTVTDTGNGDPDASDAGNEDTTPPDSGTDTETPDAIDGGGEDTDGGGGEDTDGGEEDADGGTVDPDADTGLPDADTGAPDVVDPPECDDNYNPWVFYEPSPAGVDIGVVRLDGTGATIVNNGDTFYRQFSMSTGGTMMTYLGGNATDSGLTLVDFEAGTSTRVASSTTPIPTQVSRASFSADDSQLVFSARVARSAPSRVYIHDLAAGTAEIVSPESTLDFASPVWGPDDEFIYFSKEVSDGVFNLARMRPDGTAEETLDFTPIFGSIAVNREREIVIYGTQEGGANQLYIYDIGANRVAPFGSSDDGGPAFTRCGDTTVVSRRFGGVAGDFTFNLVSLNTDTGALIGRMTTSDDANFQPTVSSVDWTELDPTNTGSTTD